MIFFEVTVTCVGVDPVDLTVPRLKVSDTVIIAVLLQPVPKS